MVHIYKCLIVTACVTNFFLAPYRAVSAFSGRGFGHVGNYDRHRKSGKCQNRSEATEPKAAPVRVVARTETVCEWCATSVIPVT